MYNFFLYFKFIKYCKLKLPLYIKTYSYYKTDDLNNMYKFNTKLTQLTSSNNKHLLAMFKKHKYISVQNKFYKFYEYHFIYKWIFLGYEKDKPIQYCNWKEFKSIYTTFFYPHLISEDEITSTLVLNKLTNNSNNDSEFKCPTEFFYR